MGKVPSPERKSRFDILFGLKSLRIMSVQLPDMKGKLCTQGLTQTTVSCFFHVKGVNVLKIAYCFISLGNK